MFYVSYYIFIYHSIHPVDLSRLSFAWAMSRTPQAMLLRIAGGYVPGVEVGLHRVVVPMIEVEVNLSDTFHVRDTKNQVLKWIENHGNICF